MDQFGRRLVKLQRLYTKTKININIFYVIYEFTLTGWIDFHFYFRLR